MLDYPDYKEMYFVLFRETTKAISALQEAQQRAEEIYIADDPIRYSDDETQ